MDWLKDDVEDVSKPLLQPWRIVIVDDDDQIHHITKLSLNNFEFEGRKLEFVSLYSAEQAKDFFDHNNDIALVLLDVVMESDCAGLEVAKYLREQLNNYYTRIIIRTGQPGSAPEHEVIRDYDIDGYKEKTEITLQALNHSLYTALRSYRDLMRIQAYQQGLEAVIQSISNLTQMDNVLDLSSGLISQIGVGGAYSFEL